MERPLRRLQGAAEATAWGRRGGKGGTAWRPGARVRPDRSRRRHGRAHRGACGGGRGALGGGGHQGASAGRVQHASMRRAASWPAVRGTPPRSSRGTSPWRETGSTAGRPSSSSPAEGPALVDELLVRRWGVPFNRDASGSPALDPGGGALASTDLLLQGHDGTGNRDAPPGRRAREPADPHVSLPRGHRPDHQHAQLHRLRRSGTAGRASSAPTSGTPPPRG